MQNGPRTIMNSHRPTRPLADRSKQWTSKVARPESQGHQNAQRSYERYLALAKAQGQAGDIVGAENYYQHAEHYFRSMLPDREAAPPVFGARGVDGKHDR
jgi:Domain of unknown function (DUF4167)